MVPPGRTFRGRYFPNRTFYRYNSQNTYRSFPIEEADGSYNIEEGDVDEEEEDYDIFQEAEDEIEETYDCMEETSEPTPYTPPLTGANATPLTQNTDNPTSISHAEDSMRNNATTD